MTRNETANATELVNLAIQQNPQITLNFTFYNETSGQGVVEIAGEAVEPERENNLIYYNFTGCILYPQHNYY